jgi:5'-3' exonuclease
MGIPYYFYTVYKKYGNTKLMIYEQDIKNLNIDYLFFDYNSMIHPCAHHVLNELKKKSNFDKSQLDNETLTDFIESQIIIETINYTRNILELIKPKNAHIVIDGVAPRAKINQQRERRYKSHFFKQNNIVERADYISQSHKAESQDQAIDDNLIQWDSNKITPGTYFMEKLTYELLEFKKTYVGNCNIFISNSDEAGEGEHKMMNYINSKINEYGSICIYGLDADLIMLSLKSKLSDNIILLRDNTFNTKLREEDKTFTYLDIKTLKKAICTELRSNIGEVNLTNDSLLQDYIFLCFLLGNDFIEHIPSLMIKENGANTLIKFYCKAIKSKKSNLLDTNSQINLHLFLEILADLSKSEEYFFKNVWSIYSKNKNNKIKTDESKCDKFDYLATQCGSVSFLKDDIIKYNTSHYNKRHYLYYGITDINDACYDYIKTLYWIIGYYNNHEHNNWDWYYPHHGIPFVSDIYNFVLANREKCLNIKFKSSIPNNTVEQLYMVLPKDSLIKILKEDKKYTYLYEKLIRYSRSNSISFNNYYPQNISISLLHCDYLWQSKVFFKHFDKNIIHLITE